MKRKLIITSEITFTTTKDGEGIQNQIALRLMEFIGTKIQSDSRIEMESMPSGCNIDDTFTIEDTRTNHRIESAPLSEPEVEQYLEQLEFLNSESIDINIRTKVMKSAIDTCIESLRNSTVKHEEAAKRLRGEFNKMVNYSNEIINKKE